MIVVLLICHFLIQLVTSVLPVVPFFLLETSLTPSASPLPIGSIFTVSAEYPSVCLTVALSTGPHTVRSTLSRLHRDFGLLRDSTTTQTIGILLHPEAGCFIQSSVADESNDQQPSLDNCIAATFFSNSSDCFNDPLQMLYTNSSIVQTYKQYVSKFVLHRRELAFTSWGITNATARFRALRSIPRFLLTTDKDLSLFDLTMQVEGSSLLTQALNLSKRRWIVINELVPLSADKCAVQLSQRSSAWFGSSSAQQGRGMIWTDVQNLLTSLVQAQQEWIGNPQLFGEDSILSSAQCLAVGVGMAVTAYEDLPFLIGSANFSVHELPNLANTAFETASSDLLSFVASQLALQFAPNARTSLQQCVSLWFQGNFMTMGNKLSLLECSLPTFISDFATPPSIPSFKWSFRNLSVAAVENAAPIRVADVPDFFSLWVFPSSIPQIRLTGILSPAEVSRGELLSLGDPFWYQLPPPTWTDFPADPIPQFIFNSTLGENQSCPVGHFRYIESDTGNQRCGVCVHSAPDFIYCPGDNYKHRCSNKPSNAEYIPQGDGFSDPNCPFICRSPTQYRSGALCVEADTGYYPSSTTTQSPCLIPSSSLGPFAEYSRIITSGFRNSSTSCGIAVVKRQIIDANQLSSLQQAPSALQLCGLYSTMSTAPQGFTALFHSKINVFALNGRMNSSPLLQSFAGLSRRTAFEVFFVDVGNSSWTFWIVATVVQSPSPMNTLELWLNSSQYGLHRSGDFDSATFFNAVDSNVTFGFSMDPNSQLLYFLVNDRFVGSPRLISRVDFGIKCDSTVRDLRVGGSLGYVEGPQPEVWYGSDGKRSLPSNFSIFPGSFYSILIARTTLPGGYLHGKRERTSVYARNAAIVMSRFNNTMYFNDPLPLSTSKCRWGTYGVPPMCQSCAIGAIGLNCPCIFSWVPVDYSVPSYGCRPGAPPHLPPNVQKLPFSNSLFPTPSLTLPVIIVTAATTDLPDPIAIDPQTSLKTYSPTLHYAVSCSKGLSSFLYDFYTFELTSQRGLNGTSVPMKFPGLRIYLISSAAFRAEICSFSFATLEVGRSGSNFTGTQITIYPQALSVLPQQVSLTNYSTFPPGATLQICQIRNYVFLRDESVLLPSAVRHFGQDNVSGVLQSVRIAYFVSTSRSFPFWSSQTQGELNALMDSVKSSWSVVDPISGDFPVVVPPDEHRWVSLIVYSNHSMSTFIPSIITNLVFFGHRVSNPASLLLPVGPPIDSAEEDIGRLGSPAAVSVVSIASFGSVAGVCFLLWRRWKLQSGSVGEEKSRGSSEPFG